MATNRAEIERMVGDILKSVEDAGGKYIDLKVDMNRYENGTYLQQTEYITEYTVTITTGTKIHKKRN